MLRYFSSGAPRPVAYGVASVSGVLLSVCAWTSLALFAIIYWRGASLGPAMAFLFSGPAIDLFAAGLVVVVGRWFDWSEVRAWLVATWDFVKQIAPWLLGGSFVAGMIRGYMPDAWIAATVGDNSELANAFASVVGAVFTSPR